MYKGFFKDVEYVMGLFFKPFEGCFEKCTQCWLEAAKEATSCQK